MLWLPVSLQRVDTDSSILGNVRVKDLGQEEALEGKGRGKKEGEEEEEEEQCTIGSWLKIDMPCVRIPPPPPPP